MRRTAPRTRLRGTRQEASPALWGVTFSGPACAEERAAAARAEQRSAGAMEQHLASIGFMAESAKKYAAVLVEEDFSRAPPPSPRR